MRVMCVRMRVVCEGDVCEGDGDVCEGDVCEGEGDVCEGDDGSLPVHKDV